jgi:hypothetical protein
LPKKNKTGDYCTACSSYRRRHNRKDRPRHLTNRNSYCRNKNCRRPLSDQKRNKTGYCVACSEYRRRHRYKKNRPPHMCLDPSYLGWCDCGNPAKHNYVFFVGWKSSRRDTLILCNQCYEYAAGNL